MNDRFWKVTVSGGYCTHGETYLDYSKENMDDAVVFWAKGGKLIGSSPKRIAYLREFVESLPGPIDPYVSGMAKIVKLPKEELLEAKAYLEPALHPLILAIAAMEETEKLYHNIPEVTYEGHLGDEVFIFYYGMDQHARVTLNLPKDKKYTIEALDTWNMTREVVATGQSGEVRVRIPQKQWMAVVATVEK